MFSCFNKKFIYVNYFIIIITFLSVSGIKLYDFDN